MKTLIISLLLFATYNFNSLANVVRKYKAIRYNNGQKKFQYVPTREQNWEFCSSIVLNDHCPGKKKTVGFYAKLGGGALFSSVSNLVTNIPTVNSFSVAISPTFGFEMRYKFLYQAFEIGLLSFLPVSLSNSSHSFQAKYLFGLVTRINNDHLVKLYGLFGTGIGSSFSHGGGSYNQYFADTFNLHIFVGSGVSFQVYKGFEVGLEVPIGKFLSGNTSGVFSPLGDITFFPNLFIKVNI